VGLIVAFFNLDIIKSGESIFSRSAERKLKFQGDLPRNAYTKAEIDRLLVFVRRNDELIESVTINATTQDSYKKVDESSPILFEMHLVLTDGGTISSPTRRTRRKVLVSGILDKLHKDVEAYRRIKKKDGKAQSLVNTM
jgi:hypothetical protein